MQRAIELGFEGGSLVVRGLEATDAAPPGCVFDPRAGAHRGYGFVYREVLRTMVRQGFEVVDRARAYQSTELTVRAYREPYDYQREALEAWQKAGGRGMVVLPTGAGKTVLATLAILARARSTLVVVPTLDLMAQWADVLGAVFDTAIGLIGGGSHDVRELTVTTYDSAHLHLDRLGNRFGLLVFDEAHHLPSDAYATAARMAIAPFRLGLTATPERSDGRETLYRELVGPTVYRKDITDLSGDYLAPYETVRLEVPLSADERAQYDAARRTYLGFVRQMGIRMGAPDGWGRFVMLSSQSEAGRAAFLAYRAQRALALAAPGKLDLLERLLHRHRRDRVLVFTDDNRAAYGIARRFLVPVITHQTRVRERAQILRALDRGELGVVATSRVLNEGVDVPRANVAIVLSGSGSVREHVQRLGRILRKHADKRALLYELVASGTGEERTSDKRRDHVAYDAC